MGGKKRYLLFIIILIMLAGLFSMLTAYQWPVENIVLKQTFGENNNGSFLSGISLGGNRQSVRPVEAGEIVFYFNEEQEYAPLPSGLGNFVVVRHDRNLFSMYSHLEMLPDFSLDKNAVLGLEDSFAFVGQSGEAMGLQLNLEIIDLEFNQLVNPLKILPPLRDTIRPTIGEVFINQGGWVPLQNAGSIIPGVYDVAVEIYDQSQWVRYSRPMAPFRINIFINGEEIFFQIFDALESKNGKLYLVSRQAQRSFNELYTPEGNIFAGHYNFAPGEAGIEIIVTDFQENRTVKNLKVLVNPQVQVNPQG